MMNSHDNCAAAAEALHEVKGPERSGRIQRRADQLAHQGLEFMLSGLCGQCDAQHVIVDIELRPRNPFGAAAFRDRNAPEAIEEQKALGNQIAQPCPIQASLENHQTNNRHRVCGPLHQQPRPVHTRQAFSGTHAVSFVYRRGLVTLGLPQSKQPPGGRRLYGH